jgi:hypothetical protein
MGMTRVMQPESWEVPCLEQEAPKTINMDNRSQPYRIEMFIALGFWGLTTKNPGSLQPYLYFPGLLSCRYKIRISGCSKPVSRGFEQGLALLFYVLKVGRRHAMVLEAVLVVEIANFNAPNSGTGHLRSSEQPAIVRRSTDRLQQKPRVLTGNGRS